MKNASDKKKKLFLLSDWNLIRRQRFNILWRGELPTVWRPYYSLKKTNKRKQLVEENHQILPCEIIQTVSSILLHMQKDNYQSLKTNKIPARKFKFLFQSSVVSPETKFSVMRLTRKMFFKGWLLKIKRWTFYNLEILKWWQSNITFVKCLCLS